MSLLLRVFIALSLFTIFPYTVAQAQDVDDTSVSDDVSEDDAFEDVIDVLDGVDEVASEDDVTSDAVLSLEEAKDLIANLPTAKDAVSGSIPEIPQVEMYDIYGRQLAFRESAKELRSSLDARRENFETPRVEVLERYRESKEKIYAAESKAYQDEIAAADVNIDEDVADKSEDNLDVDVQVIDEVDAVDTDVLKEQVIPTDEDEHVVKKVISSGGAPEFDPKALDKDFESQDDVEMEDVKDTEGVDAPIE